MQKEEKAPERVKTYWAIDLDWFTEHDRSVSVLIKDYLCKDCAKKVSEAKKEATPEALISTVQKCCAKSPDFINERLPILESVFRFFLRNGNQTIELGELGHELAQLRDGDTYHTSPEALIRILKTDRYYGIQEVKAK
jgi:hypothetical protein